MRVVLLQEKNEKIFVGCGLESVESFAMETMCVARIKSFLARLPVICLPFLNILQLNFQPRTFYVADPTSSATTAFANRRKEWIKLECQKNENDSRILGLIEV